MFFVDFCFKFLKIYIANIVCLFNNLFIGFYI